MSLNQGPARNGGYQKRIESFADVLLRSIPLLSGLANRTKLIFQYYQPFIVIPVLDTGIHVAPPHAIGDLGDDGETWMAVSSTAMTG